MKLERRIAIFDRPEEVLVPDEWEIRIVSTLKQQLHAPNGDRLVYLAKQLLEPEHVSFGRPDGTVECAEVALGDADVGVVDVPIDDVGHGAAGVLASPDAVGDLTEQRRGRFAVQRQRLVGGGSPARVYLVNERLNRRHHRTVTARHR